MIEARRPMQGLMLWSAVALVAAGCGGGGSDAGNPPGSNLYDVSASVRGLTGNGLVLQNNLAGNIAVATNGNLAILSDVAPGTTYNITVLTQPTGQTCSVTNPTGTVASADVSNLRVVCTLIVSGTSIANILKVGAGGSSGTALDSGGVVWTWGANNFDGLGVDISARTRAGVVPTLAGITQIAVGMMHQLALRSDGTVWAWGNNLNGQLGDGTKEHRTVPVQVTGLGNVQAVAAGFTHSMALLNDGTVWAWGSNISGEIGNGTQSASVDVVTPVQASGLTNVVKISAGSFTSLALRSNGTVWGWGLSTYAGLPAPPVSYTAPTLQPTLQDVIDVKSCPTHSMALRSNGTVWTWGGNNHGQLGNGQIQASTTTDSWRPAQVPGLTEVAALAECSSESSGAIRLNGSLWVWGFNSSGQLGDGTETDRPSPTEVALPGPVTHAAMGLGSSVAVMADGSVYSWGTNLGGSLGTGGYENSYFPVRVTRE